MNWLIVVATAINLPLESPRMGGQVGAHITTEPHDLDSLMNASADASGKDETYTRDVNRTVRSLFLYLHISDKTV